MSAALMVQGTASGVGKSLITAALCRILARAGWRVAPFKAQNMSNNAGVTADGCEVARAQLLQAQAARVAPDARMNPVLLKPLNDCLCDVVVLGKSHADLRYVPWHERREILWPYVTDSLDQLRASYDVVVIEGAGSPAETNLRASDIVNMEVAHYAEAPVLLVADIDRGGAFAALYGTWSLLDGRDRAAIRGFLLNRFRGDAKLLDAAPAELEARTGVRTVGCVPYLPHHLPEEDAASITASGAGQVVIAAVRLPHVANFDDLDPLAAETDVLLRWVTHPVELNDAAALILPGTRNTIRDLQWLWSTGLAAALRTRAQGGTQLIGLCGGYQMLGTDVSDPDNLEDGGACPGLGLIDMTTILRPRKQVLQTRARVTALPFAAQSHDVDTLEGYEIHHGDTELGPCVRPWVTCGNVALGAGSGSCWGTYLHGLFHNDAFRARWIAALGGTARRDRWSSHVDRELDRLADHVAAHSDLPTIESWLTP